MSESDSEQDIIDRLEELAELAKSGVEKLHEFNRSSQKIAEKWQDIAQNRVISKD